MRRQGVTPPAVPLLWRDNMENRRHNAGKGDSYRPVDRKKWDENWDRIFGKKKPKKESVAKKSKKG